MNSLEQFVFSILDEINRLEDRQDDFDWGHAINHINHVRGELIHDVLGFNSKQDFYNSHLMREQFKKIVDEKFKASMDIQDTERVVDVALIGKKRIDSTDFQAVKTNVENYETKQLLECFHEFDIFEQGIFVDSNELMSMVERFCYYQERADKFEIFANIATFLEYYSQTDKGMNFLGTITSIQDKETFFSELINEFNKHSLYSIEKEKGGLCL